MVVGKQDTVNSDSFPAVPNADRGRIRFPAGIGPTGRLRVR